MATRAYGTDVVRPPAVAGGSQNVSFATAHSNPLSPRKLSPTSSHHFLTVRELASASAPNVRLCALLLLLLYLGSVTLLYTGGRGWPVVDALYFAVVTLTTVGYGDLHPTTDGEKLFGIIMAFLAVSFIAAALGLLIDDMLAHAVREPATRSSPRRIICKLFLILLAIVLAGAGPYAYLEGASLVDALYWASITVSTIGYGDSCPKSRAGRAFAVGYVLAGTAAAARALSRLASLPMQQRQERLEAMVAHQFGTELCSGELKALLRQADHLNLHSFRGENMAFGEKKMAFAEFAVAMLAAQGHITESNLAECLKAFAILDVTHDGFLGEDDVQRHLSALSSQES